MAREGDGNLPAGPLRGIRVPLPQLKADYYDEMGWNADTGRLRRARAQELGMTELLGAFVEP